MKIFKSGLDKNEIIIYEDCFKKYAITAQTNLDDDSVDIHEVWVKKDGIGDYSDTLTLPIKAIEKLYDLNAKMWSASFVVEENQQ